MAADEALIAEMSARASQAFDILLMPLSRPELGEIRIGHDLFAIGRNEAPFSAWPADVVSVLSRRHARVFVENGRAYVADLGSKNGTTVNDRAVEQPTPLQDGDEIGFGASLRYRVYLQPRSGEREAVKPVAVTLEPVRDDVGLQPIVVADFPFLISKSDDAFARFRDDYPHQVNYVSRRHAHLFLKGGRPYVEDLGSTNGTFVAGQRVGEQAVPLEDGAHIAFGGNHFIYRVTLHRDGDATATRSSIPAAIPAAIPPAIPPANAAATAGPALAPTVLNAPAAPSAPPPADSDKTTFVAAADSFLDIFCVDYAARQEDEVNPEAPPLPQPESKADDRSRAALMVSAITQTLGLHGQSAQVHRALRWGGVVLAVLAVVIGAVYWRGASERQVQTLSAEGDYAGAAKAADAYLARHPDATRIQAIGTESLLRAFVPGWIDRLRGADYAGADAALRQMKTLSEHNPDAQGLVDELDWMGRLERFVGMRGGLEAPIRLYTDEAPMRDILKHWDQDSAAHQRALDRIAGYVPQFRDPYAQALSHVRKLQSDDAVYLAAIDRLNTAITGDTGRERPDELGSMIADYRDKYPRLAGLDRVDSDLRQYLVLDQALRARALAPLMAQLAKVKFTTPPFQTLLADLTAKSLPSPALTGPYQQAARAWSGGDSASAIAALEHLQGGAWADELAKDVAHKKTVAAQFAQLKQDSGAADHADRVLAFYASLDPDADGYYIKAVEPEVAAMRDSALRRAQTLMNGALTAWRQYRTNGAIGGEQRLESGVSAKFRSQAGLLSSAHAQSQQGMRIYAQLKATPSDTEQWTRVQKDIQAEVDLQRRALQELRIVLDANTLKAKLALIGDDEGK